MTPAGKGSEAIKGDVAGQVAGMRRLVAEIEYLSGGRRAAELSFGDERWDYRQGYDPNWASDEWFLQFLSWGPWSSTENLWIGILREYRIGGPRIGRMSERTAARIIDKGIGRGRHGFQRTVRSYLVHLNDTLRDASIGMRAYEGRVRRLGWRRGRDYLRESCGVEEGSNAKVLDCWIRDRLRLFAFPVDSAVRSVVTDDAYGLSDDPCQLVDLTREVGRNPRLVARATWCLSDELID